MKRLLALLVLITIGGLALYYWKYKPSTEGPREALGSVGEKLDAVGDKLRGARTGGSVKAAFELNRDLAPYPIDVDTAEGGVVTLKGEVPGEDVKATAGRVAASVPDVTRVVNELRVNPALAGAGGAAGRTLGESLDDKAVEAKVNLAFSLNRELKGTDLKVHSYQRQVTLSGVVDSPAQRQLAMDVARQTPSVLGVTDQIALRGQGGPEAAAVTPPAGSGSPSPAEQVRRAQQALAANASLARYRIKVIEEGGRLTLTGRVRTNAEKDLAGLLARDAAGGPITNDLELGP